MTHTQKVFSIWKASTFCWFFTLVRSRMCPLVRGRKTRARQNTSYFVILISFCCLFAVSCSHKYTTNSVKINKADNLTQRAIFQFLAQERYLHIIVGKGLPKIDPLLYSRDTTVFMGKVCFDDALYSETLKYSRSGRVAHLIIPDSLRGKFRYTDGEKDYGFDDAIIHQFSTLLPTKEPHIFLMEHYCWVDLCEEDGPCARSVERKYLKFSIIKSNIAFMGEVQTHNQFDFHGRGLLDVTRRDLEN